MLMKKNTRFLVYVMFLFFVCSGHLICTNARHHKKKDKNASPPDADNNNADSNSKIFSVLQYGATGDGEADDTSAFGKAWVAACKGQGSTMTVPARHTFKLKPIVFSCSSSIIFQLDGVIIASTNAGDWSSGLLQWINFEKINGITVQGTGTINGLGENFWNGKLHGKPTAVRFGGCNGVIFTGITLRDSPQAHLKFDDCKGVGVDNIKIISPADSPNTDGIHLQNSQRVTISSSDIACGDDAISIQTGCSDIEIYKVNSGPSHGISIGSLGKDGSVASVSNINVHDCVIKESDNGVRIKTWEGGSGLVTKVTFKNIQVTDVKTAIVIDQHYSNGGSSRSYDSSSSSSSSVDIDDITYDTITGSFTVLPMSLLCGSEKCKEITLSNINLTPSSQGKDASPQCTNAYGTQNNDGSLKCLL